MTLQPAMLARYYLLSEGNHAFACEMKSAMKVEAVAMKKILAVVGTRPEAIKMAPVISALKSSKRFEVVVVSSGQHREMLQQVVDIFGIKVDIALDIMRPNQTLAELSAQLLTKLDHVFEQQPAHMILAQGDTTTVLATALASYYRQIPFGHVEAGLRTGDLFAPFPEEGNRLLAGRLASLHFAPTEWARDNLRREGINNEAIVVTGNTVIDALHLERARQAEDAVYKQLTSALSALLPNDWQQRRIVLVTGHRRENFGQGFQQICSALRSLAQRYPEVLFVYPVHLNPNVQKPVQSLLTSIPNFHLVAPMDYSSFVHLLGICYLVLTDSGGVQEEAPALGKPVLVMRDKTERPEGIQAGTAKLVGCNEQEIVSEVSQLLDDPTRYKAMAKASNPYGNGRAAGKILDAIEAYFERFETQ